jgi:ribonuclease III
MPIVPQFILQFFSTNIHKKELQNILGFTPSNFALYDAALCHRSTSTEIISNNERLEFLGDAVLGTVVGEYLYKKYPTQAEGFLTEMRSKIVNRVTLNSIALKIGLKQIVQYNKHDQYLRNSQIFGNALEALIGAIYEDKGFAKARTFIQAKIIKIFIDLDALELEESNLKNKLIGWATKNKHLLEFVLIEEFLQGRKKMFKIGVQLNDAIICEGIASNKKEASKKAAAAALLIIENGIMD